MPPEIKTITSSITDATYTALSNMLIALAISQGVFVENFEQWFRSDFNILLVKKKAKNNPVFASKDRQVSQPMLDYIDTITVLTANSIYAALTVK